VDFNTACDIVINTEKGYVNNPADPGGETKYGISKRAYPDEDIVNLTPDRAKFLYLRDYWTPLQLDSLPDIVRLCIFDAAVNSGVSAATKWLQQSVGAIPDGKIGPQTSGAIRTTDPYKLVSVLNGLRIKRMISLPGFTVEGKGWMNRVSDLLVKV